MENKQNIDTSDINKKGLSSNGDVKTAAEN